MQNLVYEEMLGRMADEACPYDISETALRQTIYESDEYRIRRVCEIYRTRLGREATEAELRDPSPFDDIEVELMNGDEYLGLAKAAYMRAYIKEHGTFGDHPSHLYYPEKPRCEYSITPVVYNSPYPYSWRTFGYKAQNFNEEEMRTYMIDKDTPYTGPESFGVCKVYHDGGVWAPKGFCMKDPREDDCLFFAGEGFFGATSFHIELSKVINGAKMPKTIGYDEVLY